MSWTFRPSFILIQLKNEKNELLDKIENKAKPWPTMQYFVDVDNTDIFKNGYQKIGCYSNFCFYC